MITQIKSSKTAALKLSLGLMVTAALLMSFAFDKEQYTIQNDKSADILNIIWCFLIDIVIEPVREKEVGVGSPAQNWP